MFGRLKHNTFGGWNIICLGGWNIICLGDWNIICLGAETWYVCGGIKQNIGVHKFGRFHLFTAPLCGPVVRVSGYRYKGLGFHSQRYQIFLSFSGSGTGSTQPRDVNWVATWIKKERLRSRKQRLTAVGTRCAHHVTLLFPQKLALNSPTGGGRSVGIVRSRTKGTEIFSSFYRPRSPLSRVEV